MSTPPLSTRLSFAYNEPEDRMTVLATDVRGHGVHVIVTRRLADRLINGLARLLERSSALAERAAPDVRGDIILLEHQEALFGEGSGGATLSAFDPGGMDAGTSSMPRLVTAVDVTVTPTRFEVSMRDVRDTLVRLSLDRRQVHRILAMLRQRAEAAGWNIALDASWLNPQQAQVVFN